MPSSSDRNSQMLLSERDAAALFGLTPRTFQKWRALEEGPPFVRISARCVRYRREDLEKYAAERLRASTSAAVPAIAP